MLAANRQPSRSLRSRRSPARRGARTRGGWPRLNLLPVEIAPDVLRVNTDFDEQKIDTATNYAKPDSKDETLKAEKGPNQGKLVIKDLHWGFFGVRPGTFAADFYSGATVTISKKEVIDPDTERPQPGTVRLHAVKKQGQADEEEWTIPTKQEDEDEETNLVPVLYASGATIPSGSDVEYWLEGVKPGKITLVFHYTKGTLDFKHEQEFLVCTQQSKEDWQREIGRQILLETNGAVNMGGFVPTNEFTTNIPYLKAVYGYYEQLFVLYPDQFVWAGMAKMAGAPVYAGLSDAQVGRTAGGILGPLFEVLTNLGVTAKIKEFQTQLMTGNKLIFEDLGWQHRAYVASSIWALEYVNKKDTTSGNELRKVAIADWHRIDEGIQSDQPLTEEIVAGNKSLLEREQRRIIQDVYDQIKLLQISVEATIAGFQFSIPLPINYPQLMSAMTRNPIPGGIKFSQFNSNGNIANFDNRWPWIGSDTDEGLYRIWVGSSSTHPLSPQQRLDNVKIPLLQRADQYHWYSP